MTDQVNFNVLQGDSSPNSAITQSAHASTKKSDSKLKKDYISLLSVFKHPLDPYVQTVALGICQLHMRGSIL